MTAGSARLVWLAVFAALLAAGAAVATGQDDENQKQAAVPGKKDDTAKPKKPPGPAAPELAVLAPLAGVWEGELKAVGDRGPRMKDGRPYAERLRLTGKWIMDGKMLRIDAVTTRPGGPDRDPEKPERIEI